jgi:hypothetical protein
MPISRQVLWTRTEISPRFATRTLVIFRRVIAPRPVSRASCAS